MMRDVPLHTTGTTGTPSMDGRDERPFLERQQRAVAAARALWER